MTATADPTTQAELTEALAELLEAPAGNGHMADIDDSAPETTDVAIPPIVLKVPVQGSYRASVGGYDVELRVDVDGARPMRRLSADFFSRSGATVSYFGSFVVDAPAVTVTAGEVVAEGQARFTWSAANPIVRVSVPRITVLQPRKPATLLFKSTTGAPGASYVCPFESRYLRTVQWEQDSVAGTIPFVSYDTASLSGPAGMPQRVLSVAKAYQEAGIDLQSAGTPNVIPVSAAGPDAKWTDAELHAAMVNNFSLHADRPQWRVWLLVATSHVGGYRGIMFDYSGPFQRQGCAVFHDAIGGAAADSQRGALRTYVHELGHAFNLMHSWQKNLASPPAPLGPNNGFGDLSWMNYVQNYNSGTGQAGAAAYWAAFPFHYTDNEVVHLRHGFYRNVIMGANSFGTGAAEIDPEVFEQPLVDHSGLAIELRSKGVFEYGEPVVTEIKLSTTDLRGRETHGHLHPNDDLVSIAIQQPSGRTVVFRPLLRHCVDEQRVVRLDSSRPATYNSAYIGFGRDGHLFDQPGRYELRAQYVAADGSRIVSPVTELRVRRPADRVDEEVGDLLLGTEQGQLFALLGSDSPSLDAGNSAFDTILNDHGDHRLAVYARLVKGVNASRDFKVLDPDKTLTVRSADTSTAVSMLGDVEEASAADAGVDNITLNMAMQVHARAEARAGHPVKATRVLDRMVETFRDKGLADRVVATISEQAEATKADLAAEQAGD